jgi:flagellar basal-body rod modification protein FlgD
MNPITPAVSTTSSTASGSTTPVNPSTALDENTFLQLMMVQLKNQDPLNPSDPTQYLSQLAQLTSVEQQTNMAKSSAQSLQEQNSTAAIALLGHTVSYTDATGAAGSGLVQKVQFTSSGPTLTIGGADGIDPTSVYEVS